MLTDIFAEVTTSMSRNKLRIALTGFSIAWGIFMLIILLGAGNGLLNGMMSNFGSSARNVVRLWPGYTTLPYQGLPKWRRIQLDINDIEYLRHRFPKNIGQAMPQITVSTRVSYKKDYTSCQLQGFYPDCLEMLNCRITAGRNINEIDIRERRKVFLLNANTVRILFQNGENPLGQWVNLYSVPFLVVGIYQDNNPRSNNHTVYAPITTTAAIFKPDGYYSHLRLLVQNLETTEENEAFTEELRTALGNHKGFDKNDHNAVWIWNAYENYVQTMSIFRGLRIFIWIIGLATLIAGIVGISNIMLITVKERTREFGIRKALGASPRSIVGLVLLESVGITLLFGYIGMLCGVGITQLAKNITEMAGGSSGGGGGTIFLNPTVDMSIILAANGIMILAGIIAGYIPARRAVNIKPVEALAAN